MKRDTSWHAFCLFIKISYDEEETELDKRETSSRCEILVLTHGDFGRELIRTAEMIMGPQEGIHFISLLCEDSLVEYAARVEGTVSAMPADSIVFVDILGGTPSNTIAALFQKYKMRIFSGINLPMLIEAIYICGCEEREEANDRIVEVGLNGICNVVAKLMKGDEKCG